MLEHWTADDQRRVDTFTREAMRPLVEAGDPHALHVATHGFLQAAGYAMGQRLAETPDLEPYYLAMCDGLRDHVIRSAAAARVLAVHDERSH